MYDLPELRKPYFSKVQLCRHPAVNRIHRVYLLYFWRVQYICRREQLIWMRYYFDIKRKNLQQHTWYVYTWNFCPIKSFIVSKYGVVLARLRIVRKFIQLRVSEANEVPIRVIYGSTRRHSIGSKTFEINRKKLKSTSSMT